VLSLGHEELGTQQVFANVRPPLGLGQGIWRHCGETHKHSERGPQFPRVSLHETEAAERVAAHP
jgi:hypothetical protein